MEEGKFSNPPDNHNLIQDATSSSSSTTDNKSKRKWKRSLVLKHHRNHWKHLIRSTLPIFVAATISKAVSQFLEYVIGSGDIRDRIVVEFIYTIFIAHVAGYLVALYVPYSNPLFDYYFTLATDNASFAWSSSITLVILEKIYLSESLPYALIAWALIVFAVGVIIYVVNYIQEIFLHLSATELRSKIRDFESESFALAIAYSITVIIAASLYHNESTDYLSNTDDINPTTDDNSPDNQLNWLFFLYVCIISVLMFSYQRYIDNRIKKRKMKKVAQALLEKEVLSRQPPRLSSQEGSRDQPSLSVASTTSTNPEEEIDDMMSFIKDILRNHLLVWDQDKQCHEAFKSLYYVSIAYTVSCGWYIWSILTFQNLFPFKGGQIFGLFLYAILASLIVALILTIVSVKEELAGLAIDTKDVEEDYSDIRSRTEEITSGKQQKKLELKGILYHTFSRYLPSLSPPPLFTSFPSHPSPPR